VTIAVAL